MEGGRESLSQTKILMAVRVGGGDSSLVTPVLFLTLAWVRNGCRQYINTLESVLLLQANEAATPFSLLPYVQWRQTVNLGKK